VCVQNSFRIREILIEKQSSHNTPLSLSFLLLSYYYHHHHYYSLSDSLSVSGCLCKRKDFSPVHCHHHQPTNLISSSPTQQLIKQLLLLSSEEVTFSHTSGHTKLEINRFSSEVKENRLHTKTQDSYFPTDYREEECFIHP
jgi:hypothetical protein